MMVERGILSVLRDIKSMFSVFFIKQNDRSK